MRRELLLSGKLLRFLPLLREKMPEFPRGISTARFVFGEAQSDRRLTIKRRIDDALDISLNDNHHGCSPFGFLTNGATKTTPRPSGVLAPNSSKFAGMKGF